MSELFIDHKEKEQPRTGVNMILQKAGEIEHIRKSPKELGTFGTSCLMPFFQAYGILKNRDTAFHVHEDFFLKWQNEKSDTLQ